MTQARVVPPISIAQASVGPGMRLISRRDARIGVTLLPLVFALLHATGLLELGILHRLDNIMQDARLRTTMPGTLDPRIVIVDIDEKSLAEIGRWPWSRNRLAALVAELHGRQQMRATGFDFVFAEADDSSGLRQPQQLADTDFEDQPAVQNRLQQFEGELDYDARFAKALKHRPVVLGYYFTNPGGRDGSGRQPKQWLVTGPGDRSR